MSHLKFTVIRSYPSLNPQIKGSSSSYFYCPHCNRKYLKKKYMTSHMKYECGKPPKYNCVLCNYESKRKFNLKLHMIRMHDEYLFSGIPDRLLGLPRRIGQVDIQKFKKRLSHHSTRGSDVFCLVLMLHVVRDSLCFVLKFEPIWGKSNHSEVSGWKNNLDETESVPFGCYNVIYNERGTPKLQYNGHFYRRSHKPSQRFSTWRCYHDSKFNCYARVKIDRHTGLLILTNSNHNHEVPENSENESSVTE